MDWRDNGNLIRDRMRRFLSAYALKYDTPPESPNALRRAPGGDTLSRGPHCRWIENMPLEWFRLGFSCPYDPDKFDYMKWAQANPMRTDYENLDRVNGRPKNEASRNAATAACWFYEKWREENMGAGINDYGHRGEMKDFAARIIVDDIFALQFEVPNLAWQFDVESPADFIETVRELMNKPKHRREPVYRACLDYLASPAGLAFDLPPKPPSNS